MGETFSKEDYKKIKVAILAEEPFFWGSRKLYHKLILDGYSWTKGNTTYLISADFIYDEDIIKGKLKKSDFDVLIVPGGGVGNNQALLKGLTFLKSVRTFKQNIADFIKQGGGYFGVCGGAALMTNLVKGDGIKPTTLTERLYNKSSLGVSCVSSYFRNLAFPILYPFQHKHPENVGNSAYAFSFAPGKTRDGKYIQAVGCSLDVQISKDNPIFSDFEQSTRKIRWWAGQALLIPKKPDRIVKVLARYPSIDVSEDKNFRVFAWRYKGGIFGFIKGIIESFKFVKKYELGFRYVPIFSYFLAGDWELTDRVINLDHANKACMTAEIYPNENQGRIVLSTVHPEYLVWWDGYIGENDSSKFNCIGSGFHYWNDIKPFSNNFEKELTYNWWILRRLIAWAAKVPDSHLPPMQKGKITKEIEENIISKIVWDGSFFSQMKNI